MMNNQQGQQPAWPPQQSEQPPTWYPPNQEWSTPMPPPYGQRPYGHPPPMQYPPYQQPGYYPQQRPYYQPPQGKTRRSWLIVLAVVGVLVVCGIIGNAAQTQSNSNSTSNITTDTPIPTDTPTPTPNLSTPGNIQQYALQLAQNSTTTAHSDTMTSAYEPTAKTVTITETLDEQFDNSAYKSSIQGDCYNIQKAVWQGDIPHLSLVEVDISGPLVDKYGNSSTGVMGYCILKHGTEKMFQWDNLTWEQAWIDYDTAWMLPSLNQ